MKYKVWSYHLLLISLISLLFSSCKLEDDSAKIAEEKQQIEDYLAFINKKITPTASGLYFESVEVGQGDSVRLDDFVLINFKETTLDGKLLDTSNKDEADSNKIISSSKVDGPLKLYMKGISIKGLIEGLLQMKEGGHAWMLMPSSLTFYDYIPRIFEVELVKVIHDPVAYEKEKIQTYLDTLSKRIYNDIRLTPADSTSEGIYYIETLAGTGDKNPTTNDTVTVNFKINLIDGQFIGESSNNYSFRIGDNNIISGLNAGVKYMKKGGKAILIIPYHRAFGANGVTENNIIVIPMYATLIYNIELKSVGSQ